MTRLALALLLSVCVRAIAAGAGMLLDCGCTDCLAAGRRLTRRSWRGGGLLAALVLLASGGASASIDAGDAPRVVSVRHALAVGDDGRTYSLDGGVWTSDGHSLALAKELARFRAMEEERAKTPPPPPPSRTSEILSAFGAGFAAALSAVGLFKKL